MSTYAFIVGIEKYDQPKWDTAGPCRNALNVADWLLEIVEPGGGRVPPENVFLFLDPMSREYDSRIEALKGQGVHITASGALYGIDTFWREKLWQERPAGSRLLVFWSGHGFTENSGTRIFPCRDYTIDNLRNRVFNATIFLRYLSSSKYNAFGEQIFLADACSNYTGLRFTPDREEPPDQENPARQVGFFATAEGEYARDEDGQGVFTKTVLEVLRAAPGWPMYDEFPGRVLKALDAAGQTPFQIFALKEKQPIADRVVGTVPKERGGEVFQSLMKTLSPIRVSQTVYRPHYVRTVNGLGMPEMNKAQGLVGMIEELTRLGGNAASQISSGLLEFLVRLSRVPELKEPVGKWISARPEDLGNMRADIDEELDQENGVKILLVEVSNDERGDVSEFEASLREQDLIEFPGAGLIYRQVDGWQSFCAEFAKAIAELRSDPLTADFEVHFIVDPPLFDRPFHLIPTKCGGNLGEECIVVLRHRDRARRATSVVRKAWQAYADALRQQQPSAMQLIPIPAAAGPGGILPDGEGLCYTRFVLLDPGVGGGTANTAAKDTVKKVLRLGVPYLYWLNRPPTQPDCWVQLEGDVKSWLNGLLRLDDFPRVFWRQRVKGNEFATLATLLWDDPQFNPFVRKGITSK
jgi:hypothetical protein